MNTENSKTNEQHRFKLYFTDKLDLSRIRTIALANLSIYYTWENINSKYNNNKFKISGPTWSETFDLPDGSYQVQLGQRHLIYQMDHMKYQIFKIIFEK